MRWIPAGWGLIMLSMAGALQAQSGPGAQVVRSEDIAWRGGANGLSTAVLEGNPSAEGQPYALALRLDDGAWIPPHWHSRDKRILVVEGTLLFGTGEAIDSGAVQTLGPGSFSLVPANLRHYEGGRGRTIIVLYGTGPLVTTFVRQE